MGKSSYPMYLLRSGPNIESIQADIKKQLKEILDRRVKGQTTNKDYEKELLLIAIQSECDLIKLVEGNLKWRLKAWENL